MVKSSFIFTMTGVIKNPYLTNDGNTLFFSSDMNGGYGDMIFDDKEKI